MIKKIKLVLQYGELDSFIENGTIHYRFCHDKGCTRFFDGDIVSPTLDEVVDRAYKAIPNADKL